MGLVVTVYDATSVASCTMYGTGVPNVTNPYALDTATADMVNPNGDPTLVLVTVFTTNGGALYVKCSNPEPDTMYSQYVSLKARKMTESLVRQ